MKTTLTFVPYEMPAAPIGPCNPLPDMNDITAVHGQMKFDGTIPESERESFRYGKLRTVLPYLIQDGYNRAKAPYAFKSAVLENEHLKAVFLPEIGGRLWSLYDKDAGRELLYVNPVFQPANLAVRNAWYSGGVEWNCGIYGHTPFTVSPLFTASYERPDGTPVLRLYEWERVRRVAFQIEAFLPAGSKFLFIRPQLINTQGADIPMYWWSNIAVPEAEDIRVIAPADRAYGHGYDRGLGKVSVPVQEGIDKSYTTRVPRAMDWFFDIPERQRKWECAVDGGGYGLIQASTDRLVGRKLFLWGNSPGGKRWQEFLSVPGSAYLEIQAGLIQTQMQYIKMPAHARWDWLEAYGALITDAETAHGDWKGAYTHINRQLDGMLPPDTLNQTLANARAEAQSDCPPIYNGSGWAALEALRAAAAGEGFDTGGAAYPESAIGAEQAPWRTLLKTGVFPEPEPDAEPVSYMIQPEWRAMLTKAIEDGGSDHWFAWLQLGVAYYADQQTEQAEQAFKTSVERKPNAWALRNLSALKRAEGDLKGAAQLALEAAKLLKQKHIAIECGKALNKAGMYADFLAFEQSLPPELRAHGRIRVQRIEALIHTGDLEGARALFAEDLTVNDVREGEILLSDLWLLLHRKKIARETGADEAAVSDETVLERYPLPTNIDFRMSAKKK